MIIDELLLHNFGLYRGQHKIELSPGSSKKPIVLLGGLNGGGKTTVLDAIQLALYGKLARCSNRGSLAYSDYLRRCIHRHVPAFEGAGVRLKFRHTMEGEERYFSIHRTWKDLGKGIRERTMLWMNNTWAPADAERWLELMEEILPVRIAHLFFFDGEQVQQFAEPSTAAELLSTAVRALLGVDLVDQIHSDLVVLERRQKASAADADRQSEIAALEEDVHSLEDKVDRQLLERSDIQQDIDLLTRKQAKNERRLEESGANRLEQRKSLEEEERRLDGAQQEVESALQELATRVSPLGLVRPLLEAMALQADREQTVREASQLSSLLGQRDKEVLEALSELGAKRGQLAGLEQFLYRDREERTACSQAETYLHLQPDQASLLQEVLNAELPAVTVRCRDLLVRDDQLRKQLLELERRLASIPEHDAVAGLFQQRDRLQADITASQEDLQRKQGEIDALRAELEHKARRMASLLDSVADGAFEHHERGRIARHAVRARGTLDRFRDLIVARHLGRLETLILESFQHLIRKQSLICRVRIDPATFAMEVFGRDGQSQSMERLSAGERQLLAVAILWGLARASGRQLPVVIDTPLGRLDSVHRKNLVQRYFPLASRQVILLSTDEEIDEHYHKKIRSRVGRSYLLEYDGEDECTEVQEGYFW